MINKVQLANEIQDAREMRNVKIQFPNKDDPTVFIASLKVDEGLYRDVWYRFKFVIPDDWTNNVPIIRILDKIWHPNFQYLRESGEGLVHIPISHHNTKITICLIIESIKFLLIHPDPSSSFNPSATDEFQQNYESFRNRASDIQQDLKWEQEDEEDEEDT